jgi:L-ascorbate metabolism protein UlaG (beta-lactamase superfamily)
MNRLATLGLGALALAAASTGVGAAVLSLPQFGAAAEGDRRARMDASLHFADGVAQNLVSTEMAMNGDMWDASLQSLTGERQTPDVAIPVQTPELGAPSTEVQVTWMGHSTMLVELDGVRILTDPVFCERASPFQWMGPARFHPTPLPLDGLPDVDAIVISHDHYDHLDYESVSWLAENSDVPFLVPLGIGAHLEAWGMPADRIHELEWWEEREIKGVRLVSTPARHFSGRGLFDRNHTLWTSWAMVGPTQRAWYSGDTGPFEAAAEIGEKLGPFDLTMVESGAWNPAWGNIHLGPDAAKEMHEMVRGKAMMPVHWGTFQLAPHEWDQPFVRLRDLAAEDGTPLLVPVPGQTMRADSPEIADFWTGRAEAWAAEGRVAGTH